MSIVKRYVIFIAAIIIQSCGIALVVHSLLGTSPISSLPYVMSLIWPYTFGQTTFAVNMLMFLGQILVLRRDFERVQLLQVPMTLIFSYSIDVFMALTGWVESDYYVLRMLVLLIGASFVSLGVALQGIANVLMLAGEGLVYAISRHYHLPFRNVKTTNDVSLVVIAAILSGYALGTIEGIREGTLISALITGTIAKFFLHHLSEVDANGRMVLRVH